MCISRFLPPANEVWGKVIFLHLSVILFTGGVPGQVPPSRYTPLGRYPPGRYTPPWAGTPPMSRYTPWAGTPPISACLDTVNKRALRFLLECILVSFDSRRKMAYKLFRHLFDGGLLRELIILLIIK